MSNESKRNKSNCLEDLRRRILTEDLEPGCYLDETEIAEEYGLSRPPVRELLRQLAGDGYLVLHENRGAQVAPMTHKTLRNFFIAAPMTYAAIGRLAADNATKPQIMRLKDTQLLFRAAMRDGDAAQRALTNERFHSIMGEMADNEYLLPSLKRLLIDHTRIGMTFYSPKNANLADQRAAAVEQHDQFISLIEAGDADGCSELAIAHWELSRAQIESFVTPGTFFVPLGEHQKACLEEIFMKFEGIYTPVITPHRDDGSIDRDAFAKMVEHLIESGVHGVINGGSTGEYYAQSMEERVEMVKLTKEIVGDRVSLIIGTGAIRLPNSIEIAETAAKVGASAILVGSPPYSVPTERENALNALAIDRAADLPIMLYNYPGRMGINMGEEFLDRVGRSRNFCSIKESSGDINRVHLLARDYPHIQMSCGMDDQALEFFAWGARSWVCGGSNFLPKEHLALYRACAIDGDFNRGRRIMSAMMPLMRVLEQGGKFIQCIKYGCEMGGLYAGPPRAPLKPLNKDDKRQLEQVVQVVKRTIAEIEAETR